jgi:hypothetical protein
LDYAFPATMPGAKAAQLNLIPLSANSYVIARHILASKAIDPAKYSGNFHDYELFFVPNGTINDNVTRTFTVDFFDSQLLESSKDLLDQFETIPCGTGLSFYHNRMIVTGSGSTGIVSNSQHQALVSKPGEYESFNSITGILNVQGDQFVMFFILLKLMKQLHLMIMVLTQHHGLLM